MFIAVPNQEQSKTGSKRRKRFAALWPNGEIPAVIVGPFSPNKTGIMWKPVLFYRMKMLVVVRVNGRILRSLAINLIEEGIFINNLNISAFLFERHGLSYLSSVIPMLPTLASLTSDYQIIKFLSD